ncbi:FIST signal transduction protein [Magnetospirillum sulfuroxidans]|nr:FIST N-terminal domain-containing protein [Magnetospirillum sulfuroxidans]
MDVRQVQLSQLDASALSDLSSLRPDLVLVFAAIAQLRQPDAHAVLRDAFPNAVLAGCSTAGEITARGMSDHSCVVTAMKFNQVRVQAATGRVTTMEESEESGASLGLALKAPDLRAVLLFGKGVGINGSALISGMTAAIGGDVPVSGGLAGDGGAFAETLTLTPDGLDADGVIALGLYGDALRISHGSFGGWQPFGPPRKVTRAAGNILYELDGRSALALYKDYLGEYSKDLPASGLLFPFEMLDADHRSIGLIRTILGVDEEAGALILAGDIDSSGYLRLMHANNEGLVDGAEIAARRVRDAAGECSQGLGLLVSCVGRKLVMGDAVDEEVEAVSHILGRHLPLAGFYSYGEIAPFSSTTECKLHNQTMTVTFLSEA